MAKSVRYEGERDAKVEEKDTLKMFKAASDQYGQSSLPESMQFSGGGLGQVAPVVQHSQAAPQEDWLVQKTPVKDKTGGLTSQEISDQFWEEHEAAMANQTLTPEQRERVKSVVGPLNDGKAQRVKEQGPPSGKV